MIGDEGSGYWIGREALAAVMRASDGRGPATRLTSEILAHLQPERRVAAAAHRLRPRVAADDGRGARADRAGASAAQGDAVATRILERAAEELVLAARSVASRLEMRGDAFTFFLAGGVFRVVPWLAEELPRRLAEVAPRCQVQLLARGAGGRRRLARARRSARRRERASLQGAGRAADVASAMTRVRIFETPAAPGASARAATSRGRSRRNPTLVLGLPTGRTPIPLYRELVRLHAAGPRRFQPRDDVQPRRVPRRQRRRSAQLSRVHAASTCSTTSTCRRAAFTF